MNKVIQSVSSATAGNIQGHEDRGREADETPGKFAQISAKIISVFQL